MSNQMAVGAEVSYELTMQFFQLFSDTLGYSVNTEYDWTSTSSEAMGEQEQFQVSFLFPAVTQWKFYSVLVSKDKSLHF